jgi:hypothetical protein
VGITLPQAGQQATRENVVLMAQNAEKRFRFPGSIDEIGTDIQRIKQMGIDHIIFGSIDKDPDKVIDIIKQLSKFAR